MVVAMSQDPAGKIFFEQNKNQVTVPRSNIFFEKSIIQLSSFRKMDRLCVFTKTKR
jgi:hypothetical protein